MKLIKNRIDLSLVIILSILGLVFAIAKYGEYQQERDTEIVYFKPVGGEANKVEKIKLSCFVGSSKGVGNGKLWCQEVVMSEWEDSLEQ